MRARLVLFATLFTALTLVGASPVAAQTDGRSRLTLDHYLQLQGVGGPVISPDGTRIVYTRSWIDAVNDSRTGVLEEASEELEEPA